MTYFYAEHIRTTAQAVGRVYAFYIYLRRLL